MFHTLLDDPASPQESSATADIAYGILAGIREGLLPPDTATVVARAEAAILARIAPDGLLQEVSNGTAMGPGLAFDHAIPNIPTPHGQALATLFLLESRARNEACFLLCPNTPAGGSNRAAQCHPRHGAPTPPQALDKKM